MSEQHLGVGYACQFLKKSIRLGEVRLEYLSGGKGPPLLYLHGLAAWNGWDTDHIALGLTNTVYAPILPGWKSGEFPPGVRRITDYATILRQLVSELGAERIDLVGHSVGGLIAAYLASEEPGLVNRLVLVDALGLDVAEAPTARLETLDEEALFHTAFSTSGAMVVAGDFGGVPINLRSGMTFRQLQRGIKSLMALTGGRPADPELVPRLAKIAAPTLVVWGEQDGVVPLRHGEIMAQRIPHARLAIIEGAGHIPQKERGQAFVRLLRNFLLDSREEVAGVRFA
ncbi:MAG TPA: alpha/beta hydrolase [Candidatus Binataceae bacterium]|nr:alpha/beta hydrolase [Candidatus Binataceae bacterium]